MCLLSHSLCSNWTYRAWFEMHFTRDSRDFVWWSRGSCASFTNFKLKHSATFYGHQLKHESLGYPRDLKLLQVVQQKETNRIFVQHLKQKQNGRNRIILSITLSVCLPVSLAYSVLIYIAGFIYTERKKKRIFTLVFICIKDVFIL